jgi:hypothetical protein
LNKIIIPRHELQNIDNGKHLSSDCLKSLIADRFC